MKAWDEAMYWKTNEAWYRANYDAERYELTNEAPERAIESFRLYLLRNDLPVEEGLTPADSRASTV